MLPPKDPKEILDFCKKHGIEFVDLKFTDLPGMLQHLTLPISQLDERTFVEGIGFDGSSIRGWQAIHMSDMLVIPDPSTGFVDPFPKAPTISFLCNVLDPITRERYTRDPRNIAQKAANYLIFTGIADTASFGPEAEFFIFDDVRYDSGPNHAYYWIDSVEGHWNTGREENPNLGYKPRYKEGYFPAPPGDSLQDVRSDMVKTMIECGLDVECHHHEVATAGQAEIDLRFLPLAAMGDAMMVYKYVTKNVAWRHKKTVTFMPKPLFGDNGSGMHVHFSLWKGGRPLFAGEKYAGLSDLALWAIGGILHHAPALLAITSPTTNSYKRLTPGYEAPVNLAYSSRNRSACCRIPAYFPDPRARRVEFRCPDPSCNPYLAFAAILMAALDGIQQRMDPGEPLDKDIYDLPPEELAKVPSTPGSLAEALDALEANHEFLLKGDVFTPDVIEVWLRYKREKEVDALRLRPHPYEFTLYFDI